MQAGNHCASLENNAQKIKNLHAETRQNDVAVTAGTLAAKMELSDRLLEASYVVEESVQVALQNFATAERQKFAAQAIHDGTEKLLKSKISTLNKRDIRQQDLSSNILYNIDKYKKRERRDDW